ncbi:hypothetical protein V7138_07525 [Bacillus sp. JJ1533]|uniref:hypothetical protein n=1 Tax=Bacillus sp. JJ1533 TaxID=3122959 RepID=UPI002FFDB01F
MNGFKIYEVIRHEQAERNPVHVGSVRAPNERLALHSAREIFARRENCYKLTVIERHQFHTIEDSEYLGLAKDKSYRQATVTY